MHNGKTLWTVSKEDDPLLNCLISLGRYYHCPNTSPKALVAGLPLVNNRLTPQLFVRSAHRIGLMAEIIQRPLLRISKLALPAVLLLKDNQACILTGWKDAETAEIVISELGGHPVEESLSELEQNYSGYSILIRPIHEDAIEKETSIVDKNQHWFWGTLWRFKSAYSEVLVAALFINIFALVSPLFVMNVYDRVVPNNAQVTLWVLATGVIIIYVFDLILRFLRSYLIDISGKKADVLMASHLFQHIMNMQISYKPGSTGTFVNNIREFETIRDFFTSATLTTIIDLPFVFLYLFTIWYIGGPIVFIPLIAIPLVLAYAWLIEKPLQNEIKLALHSAAQKHGVLIESLTGLEILKSLNAEGLAQYKWEEHVGKHAQHGLRSRFFSASVINLTYFSQQLVTVLTIIVGVYLIYKGNLTLGGLIACNILSARALAPLGQLANLFTRYQQAKVALIGLNNIVSIPSERPADKHFLHKTHYNGEIEFKQVSFQYPEQTNKALDNVSFKIKPGEHVAIIGQIGSGKSTLQKLILGLYQPQSGNIYIDNADINQIDPAELRHEIGYAPQDSLLFAGTVRSNIMMRNPSADDERLLEVAQIAGVTHFTNLNPAGFDMKIGERGEGVSGGQRQAIAIARALLSNPSILLLDEPTSSMDERSEQELITKLKQYMENRTLLLVTHKPSLLPLVDRIIILHMGKIIADGPKPQILQAIAQSRKPS